MKQVSPSFLTLLEKEYRIIKFFQPIACLFETFH